MPGDRPTLRRYELAPAKVPTSPSLARQLHVTHHPQQLVNRIRHLVATAQPVLQSPQRDMQELRGVRWFKTQINQHGAEALCLLHAVCGTLATPSRVGVLIPRCILC